MHQNAGHGMHSSHLNGTPSGPMVFKLSGQNSTDLQSRDRAAQATSEGYGQRALVASN